MDIYKSHAITRAHFADFLYKNGYVSGRKEAFERYIGSDCPAFVQRKGISPEKGIKLIQQAQGVPILAHPYAYRLSEKHLDELISNLKDHGLAGIEAFYSAHGMSETDKVRNYAKKYDLMLSGGSDYHGKNKPNHHMGYGHGNLGETMDRIQVKAFLYTAVRNKALNELEHSKVVYEYAQNVIEKKKDSFFHDAIVEEETYRIVSEAINKLPDQMKAIMQLSLEGKKNAEIADRLNISTETVHTLKKIAYKKLRENLKDYYYFLLFFI